ncbi:MAG: SDR family oxidoreductase [Lentisphaeria bacterium]|nr:SDR family oxidoreductase [Lentisphaeria bacterium]NQZ70762.1 SDR family oxidoreductase [Lentisphaeria bacterium]
MFELNGKVAVITGAAQGLGKHLALQLAKQGCHIVALDILEDELKTTAGEVQSHNVDCLALICDIGNEAEVQKSFEEINRTFEHIDILINNAFIHRRGAPETFASEDFDEVLSVNTRGSFLCAQACAKKMISEKTGGSIINISSIAGQSALGRGNIVYSMSKAAINQMTKEMAIEWAAYKIRVNAILPCQIMTAAVERMLSVLDAEEKVKTVERILDGIPLGRMAEVEDYTGIVLLLASPMGSMITGALIPVDGGNLALNAGGDPIIKTDNAAESRRYK